MRNDFNQCFVNAKRYNAPGSGIFLDAKKLHVRLARSACKGCTSLTPSIRCAQKVLKQWYAHITGEAEAPEDDDAPAPMPQPVYQQQQQQSPLLPAPLPLYGGTPINTSNAEAGPSTSLALPASIPGTNFAKRGPTLKPWLTRKLAETTALVDAR